MIDHEIQVEIDKLKARVRELETSPDLKGARISNVGKPNRGTDVATRSYVDDTVQREVEKLRTDFLALKRKVG